MWDWKFKLSRSEAFHDKESSVLLHLQWILAEDSMYFKSQQMIIYDIDITIVCLNFYIHSPLPIRSVQVIALLQVRENWLPRKVRRSVPASSFLAQSFLEDIELIQPNGRLNSWRETHRIIAWNRFVDFRVLGTEREWLQDTWMKTID
jgi:hypothetical protein